VGFGTHRRAAGGAKAWHRYTRAQTHTQRQETADAPLRKSSLGFDPVTKKRLYARNGIPEYWILDLNLATLEVRRDPGQEEYAAHQTLASDAAGISPLAVPTAIVRSADLLP
jgi:hypothetical protein